MTVYSAGTGQGRWTTSIAAKYPLPHENSGSREWPWLVDLDSDGRTEVVVPDSGPLPPKAGFRGVRVLDGSSGQTRWVCPMRPETKAQDGLERVIDAPDLDGDGVHELLALSRFDGRDPPASQSDRRREPERVYVDALSGRDGHPLWSWHQDLAENKFTWIGVPRWWGRGPDGWPLLAVPLGGRDPEQGNFGDPSYLNPPTVHVLEASTGRELNRAMGLSRVGTSDLDGDGLVDLWGEAEGQLRAFRAEPPEAWRALGSFVPARKADPWTGSIDRGAADLDGDGIADTLSAQLNFTGDSSSNETGSRTAIARSGATGTVCGRRCSIPRGSGSGPSLGGLTASLPFRFRPATWTATARATSLWRNTSRTKQWLAGSQQPCRSSSSPVATAGISRRLRRCRSVSRHMASHRSPGLSPA